MDFEQVLAKYLIVPIKDIKKDSYDYYGLPVFDYKTEQYVLGEEKQVQQACKDYIQDNLWSFSAKFIAEETGIPSEMIQLYQEKYYEESNKGLLQIIENTCGLSKFIKDAIDSDGIESFLAAYDGREHEIDVGTNTVFIYRIN